jgi:hypothetical protein
MVQDPPEEFDEFIERGRSPNLINKAGVYAAEHNFSDEAVEVLAEKVLEIDPYESDRDISDKEERIREKRNKAAVYEQLINEFEDNEKSATRVHWNKGRDPAQVQLKEQFNLEPQDFHDGGSLGQGWQRKADLEFNTEGAIVGRGKTAHTILRYADTKDELTREEVAKVIDEYVEGAVLERDVYKMESSILRELEENYDSVSYDDFEKWAIEIEQRA